MFEKLEKSWKSKIEKHNVCDIEISTVQSNIFKNFCSKNNYVYKYLLQFQDKFTYSVAKNKELLTQFENEK